MPNEQMKVDAVFEGGGVKGIGLVGAVATTEEKGYRFENVAGTSAGAIVAALIAAGHTATEMKAILQELDYSRFKDRGGLDKIPLIGPFLSLGFEKGMYEGDFLEGWIRDLLAAKNVRSFGDLVMEEYKDDPRYRYRLQVIAADVTRGRMVVLPCDMEEYGFRAEALDVAWAVRMSMSIPFFFEPVILKDANGQKNYVVDGGVLSNYPVWLFDDGTGDPTWPTLGYKLVEPTGGRPNRIRGPVSLFAALFSTMMEAHDAYYIDDNSFARTIPIPTLGVGTTEFDISRDRSEELYESGRKAAEQFFQSWDFEKYKTHYRQASPGTRRQRT